MLLEDFYEEILKKLGTLAAEEPASPSDRLAAKEKYEALLEEYGRRDLITWFSDEDVPDWISDSFAAITAFRLTDKFSVSAEIYVKLENAAAAGETVLIGDGQRRGDYNHPPTDFF